MKKAWGWIGLLLLLTLVGLGITRLKFDTEILSLLPQDITAVRGLKVYEKRFTNARELILAVEGPNREVTAQAADSIARHFQTTATNRVESAFSQPPWTDRPDLSSELVAFLWLNQPPEEWARIQERLSPQKISAHLTATKERLAVSLSPQEIAQLSYDPLGLLELPGGGTQSGSAEAGDELFSSPEGTFRVVFLQAREELRDFRECQAFLRMVQNEIETLRRSGEVPAEILIRSTGRPAFVAEISQGMQSDLQGPSGGTLLVIALLFYWVHRRWLPMLWLVVLLLLTLGATLAIGGLIYGKLSVVSLGFASILLGLGEDFGIILYQESRVHPELGLRGVRRSVAPGILWSALTTAGAFLVLHLLGLPGLSQMGTLVAVGIVLAAGVMLFFYLPPLASTAVPLAQSQQEKKRSDSSGLGSGPLSLRTAWIATGLVLALGASLLVRPPVFDPTPASLQPRNSEAYDTLDAMKGALARGTTEPIWLVVEGANPQEVVDQLKSLDGPLQEGVRTGVIDRFQSALPLVANPEARKSALTSAAAMIQDSPRILQTLEEEGFSEAASGLYRTMTEFWSESLAAGEAQIRWPDNVNSRWILGRLLSRDATGLAALALIYPSSSPQGGSDRKLEAWLAQLPAGITPSGWELLGPALSQQIKTQLPVMVTLITLLLVTTLWLAFRNFRDVLLCLTTVLVSAGFLAAVMSWMGWQWNLLNVMALPLLLGLGVDYGIHILGALWRYQGDLRKVHNSVGKALLLAGSTTIVGFGALSFSSNAGMASLGKVTACGIAAALLISVYLLPAWWVAWHSTPESRVRSDRRPSSFYGVIFWSLGRAVARRLPEQRFVQICQRVSLLYARLAPSRRAVVQSNLQGVLQSDRATAEAATRELFLNFGTKLAHLWRYEAGESITHLFGPPVGWDHYLKADRRGRGLLLLTLHLGNWEFGAPLLARQGVKLLVITLFEPNDRMTTMRQEARARWGIETLVIGRDPFAFVEVIRRLDDGATVALLMDRPPLNSGTTVNLLGRPFDASVSAAELARATGCVLLPTLIPLTPRGYEATVLPEIVYDRLSLKRENRALLTQKIMEAFEPQLREHVRQWYHFVPVWKEPNS